MIVLDSTSVSVGATLANTPITSVDVFASYVDLISGTTYTVTPSQINTTIAGTGQNTIISAPSSGTYRQLKYLSIFNKDIVNTITIYLDTGAAAAGPVDYTAAFDSNDASNTIVSGSYAQLTDLSGNANHLVQSNPNRPPQALDADINKNVVAFDGATWLESSVSYTSFVSTNAWTVIAETKPTTVPASDQTLFTNQNNAVTGDTADLTFQGLHYRHNSLIGLDEVGSSSVNSDFSETATWTAGIQINAWNTLVGRLDGTHVSIQANRNVSVLSPVVIGGVSGTADVALGRSQTTASSFFTGNVRRVRYWNRALTSAEIQSTLDEFSGFNVVRNLFTATLQHNEMLQYTDDEGWAIFDAAGNRKINILRARPTLNYYEPMGFIGSGALANGTFFLQRAVLPSAMNPDVAMFGLRISNQTNAGGTITASIGAYTFTSQTLFLKASGIRTIAYNSTDVHGSYSLISGTKLWSIPLISWSLSSGDYVLGFGISTTSSVSSGTISVFENRGSVSINGSEFGAGVGNGTAAIMFGNYSATTAILPTIIQWSEINQTGAGNVAVGQPWLALAKTNQTS